MALRSCRSPYRLAPVPQTRVIVTNISCGWGKAVRQYLACWHCELLRMRNIEFLRFLVTMSQLHTSDPGAVLYLRVIVVFPFHWQCVIPSHSRNCDRLPLTRCAQPLCPRIEYKHNGHNTEHDASYTPRCSTSPTPSMEFQSHASAYARIFCSQTITSAMFCLANCRSPAMPRKRVQPH
jgi:hypothetical protein